MIINCRPLPAVLPVLLIGCAKEPTTEPIHSISGAYESPGFIEPAHLGAKRFDDWSAPTNLGGGVNSAFFEAAPAISKDGLSLYFHSIRPPAVLNDIYVSQRSSKTAAWGPAVKIELSISTDFNEVAPAFSRDGHYLFISTDRPGGLGGLDIWVSYREHVHDDFAWGDPVPITSINAPAANDAGVAYFENEDGRPQLFFQSNRPGGAGFTDFYVSEQREDATWSSPTRVAELSSPGFDNRLTIRHDGLEVFFHSDRTGSAGDDLWTSTRATVSDPWSTPVNVGLPINTASSETQPGLSPAGETLYFASNRPGSLDVDIWVATRARLTRNARP